MITLRTYLNEIENFIDQNVLDQVVAHSTHILKTFPNSYESMRFLAQAYLEEKKFKESAAIFEKILTIVPDDFVSHVGMSSIKEEQQDLDSAIFHMELAYDTQPSNVIVQDELKRLLEKRDGERPSKINLSRGSLIRMYIKGDLHQQALNEISAAITENPDRFDLQVLKAIVYANSNDKVRAAETCNLILEKFPYCLEANRILYEIFTERGLKNQSSQVLERLATVNPYYKFVNNLTLKVEDVPDSKIELEKLDYTSAFSAGFQEFWSPPIKNPTTDSTDDTHQDNILINTDDLPLNNLSDSPIPEFLSSAGWEKSDTPNNEPPEPVDYSNSDYVDEPQKNAELPEWLKNFQPSSNFIEDSPLSFPSNDEPVIIIDEKGSDEGIISTVDETPQENISSLSEVAMTTDNPENNNQKDDTSDWMSQFFEDANKSVSEPEEEKSLPDWLKTLDQEESISENSPDDEAPDWLKNLDSQIINTVQDEQIEQVDQFVQSIPSPEITMSSVDEGTQQVEVIKEESQEDILQSNLNEFVLSKEIPEDPSFTLDDLVSPSSSLESNVIDNQVTVGQNELESSETNESILPDWVKSVLSSPEEEIVQTSVEQNQAFEAQPTIEDQRIESNIDEAFITSPQSISEPISEGAISKETGEELLQWLSEVSTDKTERSKTIIDDFSPSDFDPTIDSRLTNEDAITSNLTPESMPEFDQKQDATSNDTEPLFASQISEQVPNDTFLSLETQTQSAPEISPTTETSQFSVSDSNQELSEVETTIEDLTPSEVFEPGVSETEVTPEKTSSQEDISEAPMESSVLEEFEHYLNVNNYQDAKTLFSSMNSAGYDNDKILKIITSGNENKFTNFEFMQFLGDTLAEFNHFDQAMEIYTQAENLLTGK